MTEQLCPTPTQGDGSPVPPPELKRLWGIQAQRLDPHDPVAWNHCVADKAAAWGADQELEACCAWLRDNGLYETRVGQLRAARRPKLLSLKKQALTELNLTADPDGAELSRTQVELIRRALEQLND